MEPERRPVRVVPTFSNLSPATSRLLARISPRSPTSFQSRLLAGLMKKWFGFRGKRWCWPKATSQTLSSPPIAFHIGRTVECGDGGIPRGYKALAGFASKRRNRGRAAVYRDLLEN